MVRDTILLDGVQFRIATGRNGERLVDIFSRPSQPGDPGDLLEAVWRVDGPDFNSFEQIPPGGFAGYLGRDYGAGTDGRWLGLDQLGPLVNTVALSAHDNAYAASLAGTATFKAGTTLRSGAPSQTADTEGMAIILGPDGTPYGYFGRGTTPAKVDLTDMSLKRSGEQLPENATSLLATLNADDEREVSIGMDGAPYRVLTVVAAPPNSDTYVTNDESKVARILATAPDRIVGGADQTLAGNILETGVSMASPAWFDVSTIQRERLKITGFAMDGPLWVPATSQGPYSLDPDTGKFYPLIPELRGGDDETGRGTTEWSFLGALLPSRDGSRFLKHQVGDRWGPELFGGNTSPIQGRPLAYGGSTRWLLSAEYNEEAGDTYIIAWRERVIDDPHPHALSPHVIAVFSGLRCRLIEFIDTVNGERASPTWVLGHGSNLAYITAGRRPREIDDTLYRNASSGTTFLTELRRQPGLLKDVEAIEFVSAQAGASDTITIGASFDEAAAVSLTGTSDYTGGATLNGVVNTSGFQRVLPVDDSGVPLTAWSGRTIKPQLAYSANANTASPQVVGTLRIYYRVRPLHVKVYRLVVLLDETESERFNAEELEGVLLANERDDGPVELQDLDKDTVRVKVQVDRVHERDDIGAGEGSARGSRRVAEITLTIWQVAA